jgi:hypothetical protein
MGALEKHCAPNTDRSHEQLEIGPMRLIVIIVAILCRHAKKLGLYNRMEVSGRCDFDLIIDNSRRYLSEYTLERLLAEGNVCASAITGTEADECRLDWAYFSAWIANSLDHKFRRKLPKQSKPTSDGSTGGSLSAETAGTRDSCITT